MNCQSAASKKRRERASPPSLRRVNFAKASDFIYATPDESADKITPTVDKSGHRSFDYAPTSAEASIFAKATTDKSEGKQRQVGPLVMLGIKSIRHYSGQVPLLLSG